MLTMSAKINGIDVEGLRDMIGAVAEDGAKAGARFTATSRWRGGTRSETAVDAWEFGGKTLRRGFNIVIDEPRELLGNAEAPNPQEMLMAAVNACMMVGFVAQCAVRGIRLESLEFETTGRLDLRGFLGVSPDVPPGYERVESTIRVRGDATPEQFAEILAAVRETSPNYYNLTRPIRFEPRLEVR